MVWKSGSLISQKGPTGLQTAAKDVLAEAPDRFILGAECALLDEINWQQGEPGGGLGSLHLEFWITI